MRKTAQLYLLYDVVTLDDCMLTYLEFESKLS